MAPPRHPLRRYVVSLLERGELVSIREATMVCDASRQAISRWVKEARVDLEVRRGAYVARLRTNADRYLEGLAPTKRPSKRQMRKIAAKALKDWNEANGKTDERQSRPT